MKVFLYLHFLNVKVMKHSLQVIKATKYRGWSTCVIDITYPTCDGAQGLIPAIDRIAAEACQAAKDGYQLLVLSDKQAGPDR